MASRKDEVVMECREGLGFLSLTNSAMASMSPSRQGWWKLLDAQKIIPDMCT